MTTGLKRVREILDSRAATAKSLQEQGKKLIGYWCSLTPVELITAAGLVPYLIDGDIHEAQNKADTCIEPTICGWVRSCFDLGLKGKYDFLSGLVVPHACNSMDALGSFWKWYIKPPLVSVVNVPHIASSAALDFFSEELLNFKRTLEEFTGEPISENKLNQAIALHAEKRKLLRELCLLKKKEQPALSGVEMLEIAKGAAVIPPEESIPLLRQVLDEVTRRKKPAKPRNRLMVYGMSLDAPEVLSVIENTGSSVVMGYFCPDARTYWYEMKRSASPFDDLSRYYLGTAMCSRTYEPDRASTLGLAQRLCQDFNVNGCICYVLKYCDAFESDMPDLKSALDEIHVPVLELDADYSLSGAAAMKTRVEAFIETLGE